MRNLVEVKHETKEAVFEVLGTEGETETYEVGSGKSIGVWVAVAQRVERRVLIREGETRNGSRAISLNLHCYSSISSTNAYLRWL